MHKINLLRKMKKGQYIGGVYHPPKKSRILKFFIVFLITLSVGFFSFSWQVFSSYQGNQNPKKNNPETGIISNIGRGLKNLVTLGQLRGKDKKIKGEEDDRVNVLLLGMGGRGHDGPYLSDTIIVASIEPSTNKIALISIPRDLYVPIGEYGWHKINHANAYGEAKKGGHGAELASKTVGKILNIPIHYYVNVDFSGFQKIIDDVGKIKVYVENSFIDEKYPDNNYGYEPISFTKGWEIMDGDRALKYARSRHGSNNESSDFARSLRQQKVLAAFKEKISSFRFWLNPGKIGNVLADLDNHINTNMETWEIIRMANLIKKNDLKEINSIVLSDSKNGHLYPTNVGGAYVLLPKGNDFTTLKILAKNALESGIVAGATVKEKDFISIEVQNGTKIAGLAARAAKELKQDGFKITKIGNALTLQNGKNYKETIIYDVARDTEKEKLRFLEKKFDAMISSSTPEWLISESVGIEENSSSDIVIILGENNNLVKSP